MKKCKVLEDSRTYMQRRLGEKTDVIMKDAYEEWRTLCAENAGESKAVKKHTHNNIYPAIAMYRAMLEHGVTKEDAFAFLDWSYSERAIPKAKAMQGMCKLPGMYKKMPAIFKKVTNSTFSTKQGFQAKWYDMGKTRCKFDMTRCLFYDTCKRYGVEEIVPCFCHTDDVTDGNIHPKLCWNRTKTIGEGGDVCDFDLFVVENKK